jgi:TPR repeat protein
MGRSAEALESFRRALEADPRQLESLLNVGLVHAYDLHQPEEAASAWAKLYALDPRTELAARARWEIGKLGNLYGRGDGVLQDWARANALFEKSCDLGEMLACEELAASFAIGRGVPRDRTKVEALRKKACDLGDGRACGTSK